MTNCNGVPTPVAVQLNPEVTSSGVQDYTRCWTTLSNLLTSLQTSLFNLQTCVNTISGGASPATTVQPVGPSDVVGVDTTYAREDHVHAGVSDVGGATGSITVGTGLALAGNTLSTTGGGGGPFASPPTKITIAASPYTPPASNVVIFADTSGGPITVNMPAASLDGVIVIMNTGTINTVTVGGATGITTIANTSGHTSVWYISDGTNWSSFTNSQGN